VKLEFQTSKSDWMEAHWIHRRQSPDTGNPATLLNVVGFAATALGALLLSRHQPHDSRIAPIALIVVGLFIPLRQAAIKHAQWDRAFARFDRVDQPEIWNFGDTIQISRQFIQVIYAWPAFMQWVEGPTVFLLYQTEDHYSVIPKSAFASEPEMVEFRRLLAERIIPRSIGFLVEPQK
jgi:hypothetical protein